jgi:hypothetical protein
MSRAHARRMKNFFLSVLLLVAAVLIPNVARADETSAPMRTERNSLALMITGIGLTTVGLLGVGAGTGLIIQGHRNCDQDAAGKTVGLSTAEASALYPVADDICVGESPMINGGLVSLAVGSVFAAAGIAFTVAGSWKVTVPNARASTPRSTGLRVGLGSVGIAGSF